MALRYTKLNGSGSVVSGQNTLRIQLNTPASLDGKYFIAMQARLNLAVNPLATTIPLTIVNILGTVYTAPGLGDPIAVGDCLHRIAVNPDMSYNMYAGTNNIWLDLLFGRTLNQSGTIAVTLDIWSSDQDLGTYFPVEIFKSIQQ